MQIFLSWSGARSKAMALALRDWLPQVVQAFEPFMSEEDIKKGERGFAVLADQLDKSKCGILCVTPENREKPWIMFEAGAIGKSVDGRVNVLLLEGEPGQLHAALGQFQATRCDKEDVFKLVESLNAGLADQKLAVDRLRKSFDKWWPDLEASIARAAEITAEAAPAKRSVEDIATETLETVRQLVRDFGALQVRPQPVASFADSIGSQIPIEWINARAALNATIVPDADVNTELEKLRAQIVLADLAGKVMTAGNLRVRCSALEARQRNLSVVGQGLSATPPSGGDGVATE